MLDSSFGKNIIPGKYFALEYHSDTIYLWQSRFTLTFIVIRICNSEKYANVLGSDELSKNAHGDIVNECGEAGISADNQNDLLGQNVV